MYELEHKYVDEIEVKRKVVNSQNFLGKFVRFKVFFGVVIHRKWVLYDLYSSCFKKYFKPKNLKILRPNVTKNLTNFCKKYCEYPPWPTLFR